MSKFIGTIVALIGIAILVAGACSVIKPKKSTEAYLYEENSQIIGNLTDNPAEDDTVVEIGGQVVDVNHRVGIFDVEKADSIDQAESTATKAGLATSGLGFLILIIGGILARSETTVIVKGSSDE